MSFFNWTSHEQFEKARADRIFELEEQVRNATARRKILDAKIKSLMQQEEQLETERRRALMIEHVLEDDLWELKWGHLKREA